MAKRNYKLLMIIGQFYPNVGGAEKECQNLSKGLTEKGFSVRVLTQYKEGLPEYEEIEGIPVYRKIKGWHLFELTYMFSVLYFLIRHRKHYETIQCFGLYLFIPPALLMKYLFRKKVVARIECSGRFGDFWRIKQLKWKKLVISSSKRFDKIIFISSDIKRELIENQFPIRKLVRISNSVDIDKFKPCERLKDRGLKNICFIGRLEEQKGVEYLIRAMDIIKSKTNCVRLFIVGEGKLKTHLEELCKMLELENLVTFVGITHDVLPYYQDASIFVLPSISEGLSLTLLEAMASGLPVIATVVGGNTELVNPSFESGKTIKSGYHVGENGILINSGDARGLAEALLKLLSDEKLSKQLGTKARTHVEKNYSLKNIINKYLNLYNSLL